MAYCINCGKELENEVDFCTACGTPVNVASSPNEDGKSSVAPPEFSKEDIDQNKAIAIFSYISFFVLVPILAGKSSPFARFHANQGLVLLLLSIVGTLCIIVPIIGIRATIVVFITVLALRIVGVINVIKGKAKELPIIGKYKIM